MDISLPFDLQALKLYWKITIQFLETVLEEMLLL